jgi:hypothetical protein
MPIPVRIVREGFLFTDSYISHQKSMNIQDSIYYKESVSDATYSK